MLQILGRQIPNLQIETAVDKTLYIDIDHHALEPVLGLATTTTYIITNRALAELSEVISAGFYNIAIISQPSQITVRYITNFINTDYYDNSLKIISRGLLAAYSQNESLVTQLYNALIALRDDNAEAFSKIMASNLMQFIESIDDINAMISYCRSLNSTSEQYSQTMAKAAKVEALTAEIEHYQGMYEDLKAAKAIVDADNKDLEERLAAIQTELNLPRTTEVDIHNHVEYKSLQAQLETTISEKNAVIQEFNEYRQNTEEAAALAAGSSKDKVIQHLRDEIKKLKEFPFDQTISSCMPVLQEATTLNAEHLLYFKEVRPTVYINGAIYWLTSFMNIRYRNMQRKEYLILVFDPLIDQYTMDKYSKHGWSINQQPSPANHVLITNCFDYSKLKSLYHIEDYDCIICFDRTHVKPDAITIKRCKRYYFINTTNDITDFGLEPASCIGFFEAIPSGATVTPRYRIKPWDKALTAYTDITRSGKFTEDKVFSVILEECGVITKV